LQITAHSLIPSFYTIGMKKESAALAEKLQDEAMHLKENPDKPVSKEKLNELSEIIFLIENVCKQAFEELKEELLVLEKQ
jgi:uncharacterized protein (DUF2164 family)